MKQAYSIFDAAALGASLAIEQTGTVLAVTAVTDINRSAHALFPETIGRWYAELMVYGPGNLLASVGIVTAAAGLATYVGGDANGYGYRLDLGQIHHTGASVGAAVVASKGDIIGVLLDLTTSVPTVAWYRNGQLAATQDLPSTGPWMLAASLGGSEAYGLHCFLNAGQRAFEYAPSGAVGWYEPAQEVRGVHVASEDWLSATTDLVPNDRYRGLLAGDNNELRAVRALDFWPWQRGIKTGAMVLTVLDADGVFDELLTGDARDLPVRVGQIAAGQTYADRSGLYNAVIDSVATVDDVTVKITCRDALGLLEVPLQRRLIRPNADPSAANTPWPVMLGACRNVEAILIDAGTWTYAVSDAPILGVGFARDRGYPLSPTAVPADFTLGADKLTLKLRAQPQGKVTVDVSSVGGQQLPQPSNDVLGGAGSPMTGANGSPPTGWNDVGGDVPQASPVMNGGALEFPLVQVAPTIYASMPVYTNAATGSVVLRLSWINAEGQVVGSKSSAASAATQAWTVVDLIDTAPSDAVSGRLEAVTNGHTAGVIRAGALQGWYVQYGDHQAIGLQNPSFETGLTGWTATSNAASWQQQQSAGTPGYICSYFGAGASQLKNDGVAPVTPGKRITAYCNIGLNTLSGGSPAGRIALAWLDAANGVIDYSYGPVCGQGNQGKLSLTTVTGTAPAGAAYAQLWLFGEGPGGQSGPKFDACGWDFVLEPAGGQRIPIDLQDFTLASAWQTGANWSLQPAGPNGYNGAAYAEHAPAAGGSAAASSSLLSTRPAYVRQAVAYAGWAGITTAKFGAGKSYQLKITIDAMPSDGLSYVGLATGKTLDTMIASWKKAGTYVVNVTNSDTVDHPLYLLAVPYSAGSGAVPTPPAVSTVSVILYDDTYTPNPIDTTPALLQPIKLADYMHQILDVRAAALGLSWSLADAQAIDTATAYTGVGAFLRGGETVRQALDLALASYTACLWSDAGGQLRVTRLIAPESVAQANRTGTIDINAMGGDLMPVLDAAPGLTTQMGVRPNWTTLGDGDLVAASANFPLAVRQAMLRTHQVTVSTAQPLAGAYRHALYAPPVGSCFDAEADGQAEIDRVAAIYATPRWFYAVSIELDALPGIELGQVWTLVYPKHGLAAGKPVLVVDLEPDLLAGTANLIVWG